MAFPGWKTGMLGKCLGHREYTRMGSSYVRSTVHEIFARILSQNYQIFNTGMDGMDKLVGNAAIWINQQQHHATPMNVEHLWALILPQECGEVGTCFVSRCLQKTFMLWVHGNCEEQCWPIPPRDQEVKIYRNVKIMLLSFLGFQIQIFKPATAWLLTSHINI